MSEPRLKSEFRVAAQLRRAHAAGAFAVVARRGDPDAGSIAVKVYLGRRLARLYVQARDHDGNPIWREPFEGAADEDKIDAYLDKERRFDSDLWIIEIEDRNGDGFLD
ncbi:MAG: hypothetical protein A3E78_00735 [Alphaproteobacteria bacterium RIFCSPHIGHO2_12_FULL_63_12]|nr:MAG: hypothetical protein A3E78_00735 [Alphaproteobacteria bacterium RIFCSPHIGHO2_12_FULL_63_12]